jgi:hypothetical protein
LHVAERTSIMLRRGLRTTAARGHELAPVSVATIDERGDVSGRLAEDLLLAIAMKTRHAFIVLFVTVLMVPVVVSLGAFFVLPIALVMVPSLAILAGATLAAALVALLRAAKPGPLPQARVPAPVASTALYP